MRLLVLGGSFNPPHWGHLLMAEEVREEFGYDRVLFIPAARPPHKELFSDPGADHRLAMLRLAVADNPAFSVDACELERQGPSYTVDTLADLIARIPMDGKPGFVLGDDLVPGFSSWKDPDRISSIADIIVARRGGGRVELSYPHRRAENRLIPLSSSELREKAARGSGLRYLMPEPVRAYIKVNRLYGCR